MGRPVIDLTGRKLGFWTVVRRVENGCGRGAGVVRWLCRCECGTERVITGGNLKRVRYGEKCICHSRDNKLINLTGQGFDRLTVIKRSLGKRENWRGTCWVCRCECGNIIETKGSRLRAGYVTSCGCKVNERAKVGFSGAMRVYFRHYQESARKKKRAGVSHPIAFELSFDQFQKIVTSDCHWSGAAPAPRAIVNGSKLVDTILVNGIDRKDNSIGYTVANCVPCCTRYNMLKKDMPLEQWLAILPGLLAYDNKTIGGKLIAISQKYATTTTHVEPQQLRFGGI